MIELAGYFPQVSHGILIGFVLCDECFLRRFDGFVDARRPIRGEFLAADWCVCAVVTAWESGGIRQSLDLELRFQLLA